MNTLEASVRTFADARDLLTPDSPALLMVSGGGDSVALLHLFARGVFGARPLRVLHVDHGLRGEESERDARHVAAICAELGITLVEERVDVAALARDQGLNLEDAGRRVRYEAADRTLDAWCLELKVPPRDGRIVVAHTRDDRVETFFMRAAAGAGPGALASIRARRGRVVRPLLGVDRAQVRAWLEDHDLAWHEDASNEDIERTRAFVRSRIVPEFERLAPGFRAALERSLDLLADDDALLDAMAAAFARDFARSVADEMAEFDCSLMATLERTMARRTVRCVLRDTFSDASRIDAAHIEAIVDGMSAVTFARDIPGGLRARGECGTLVVSRIAPDSSPLEDVALPLPGRVDLAHGGIISASETTCDDTAGGTHSVTIDATSVTGDLTVGSVREGDRMRPFGMEGTRKLSDLLIDAKVPRASRAAVPVVKDGERIIWLAGVRMSEEYRVTGDTRRAMRLTWEAVGPAPGTAVESNGADE